MLLAALESPCPQLSKAQLDAPGPEAQHGIKGYAALLKNHKLAEGGARMKLAMAAGTALPFVRILRSSPGREKGSLSSAIL